MKFKMVITYDKRKEFELKWNRFLTDISGSNFHCKKYPAIVFDNEYYITKTLF